MCGSGPGARPLRLFSQSCWPSHPGSRQSRSTRRLAALAASSAPIAASAAAAGAAAILLASLHLQSAPHPPVVPTCHPLLASTTSSLPSNILMELLGPHLTPLATQWVAAAGAQIQRFIEKHLAELHQGGCPGTSAVLRAHLYGAAVQVATLGFATRLLVLDRGAVLQGQIWRLLSWSLVHAGPLHLAANYITLAKLAPQLERVAGQKRFTAIYVGSAAAATVLSLALNGGRLSLGSSGAVFGLAAALWRYQAVHCELLPAEAAEALRVARRRALQLALGYHVLLWSRLDVSAHLGGALGGGVLAAMLGPDFRLEKAPGPGPGLGLVGWPLARVRVPFGSGGGGTGNGTAAATSGGMQFRDRPRWRVFADSEPRGSIPFPELGSQHHITVAAAAAGRVPNNPR